MTRQFPMFAACVFVSACSTPLGVPPIDQVQAFVDKRPVCQKTGRGTVVQHPLKAELVTGCGPFYPSVLRPSGIDGVCRSMFDLDEQGHPTKVEVRCNIAAVDGNLGSEWEQFATETFIYTSERALTQFQYEPASEARPDEWRDNYSMAFVFRSRASRYGSFPNIASPEPFERPSPAPPLPDNIDERLRGTSSTN